MTGREPSQNSFEGAEDAPSMHAPGGRTGHWQIKAIRVE